MPETCQRGGVADTGRRDRDQIGPGSGRWRISPPWRVRPTLAAAGWLSAWPQPNVTLQLTNLRTGPAACTAPVLRPCICGRASAPSTVATSACKRASATCLTKLTPIRSTPMPMPDEATKPTTETVEWCDDERGVAPPRPSCTWASTRSAYSAAIYASVAVDHDEPCILHVGDDGHQLPLGRSRSGPPVQLSTTHAKPGRARIPLEPGARALGSPSAGRRLLRAAGELQESAGVTESVSCRLAQGANSRGADSVRAVSFRTRESRECRERTREPLE